MGVRFLCPHPLVKCMNLTVSLMTLSRHVWVGVTIWRRYGKTVVTIWRRYGKDDMLHYDNTLGSFRLRGMCLEVPVVTHVSLCFLRGYYVLCIHGLEYVYDIVMLMLCIWKAVNSLIVLYPRVLG